MQINERLMIVIDELTNFLPSLLIQPISKFNQTRKGLKFF